MSIRTRVGTAAGVAAIAVVATVIGLSERTASTQTPDVPPVPESVAQRFKIDCHVHFRATPEAIKETVAVYRKYNTMACAMSGNTAVLRDAAAEYPDVFIPFGSIRLDDPDVLKKIDEYHAAGFKGVGEISGPEHNYDDPIYDPIYSKLQDLGMVALFHTGIVARGNPDRPQNRSWGRMRPVYLDTIARKFPKLRINGAHMGNPWYEEAAEGARWSPNLVFDISGSSLFKKTNHPEYWGEVLWWRPGLNTRHSPPGTRHAFEKLVFATDEGPQGLVSNMERFQQMLDANKVPAESRDLMWSGTMAKVLGVTPRSTSTR